MTRVTRADGMERGHAAVGELVGNGVGVGAAIAVGEGSSVAVAPDVAVLVGVGIVVDVARVGGRGAVVSVRDASVEVGVSKKCGGRVWVGGGELTVDWWAVAVPGDGATATIAGSRNASTK